jgi:hypothetical protein
MPTIWINLGYNTENMKNESKFLGKTVIVTKELDETPDHLTTKIKEGDQFIGRLSQFEEGYSAIVETSFSRSLQTSAVRVIDEDSGTFQTQNSLYKIELHPEQVDYDSEMHLEKAVTPMEENTDVEPMEQGEFEALEGQFDVPGVPMPEIEAPHYGNGAAEVEMERPQAPQMFGERPDRNV